MRYVLLLIVAVVFLTGLVWWILLIGNSTLRLVRRR